jgi:hypothetical protein
MKSPEDIRALIAAKLLAEELPKEPPGATLTGTGSGTPCDACDAPILPADVECACEFPLHSALRFHVECFTEWRRQQPPG